MQVEAHLQKIIDQEGKVHLTLIDPASQTPERAAEIALAAVKGGTDAIMIGGSTGASGTLLDETVIKINEIAAVYALAGKYLGMHYTYLEAGSGADTPISPEMIGAVKQVLGENKLIVGGGIRDAKTAKLCASAGADMIVTGTILEEVKDVTAKVAEIVSAIKR